MATLDPAGTILNIEEYLPYGETSFGSYTRKRYRYTGRERDGESGLTYHHARYYAPWQGRWASCDPSGQVDGVHLYCYARAAPTGRIDPSGRESAPSTDGTRGRRKPAPRGTKMAVKENRDTPTDASTDQPPSAADTEQVGATPQQATGTSGAGARTWSWVKQTAHTALNWATSRHGGVSLGPGSIETHHGRTTVTVSRGPLSVSEDSEATIKGKLEIKMKHLETEAHVEFRPMANPQHFAPGGGKAELDVKVKSGNRWFDELLQGIPLLNQHRAVAGEIRLGSIADHINTTDAVDSYRQSQADAVNADPIGDPVRPSQ